MQSLKKKKPIKLSSKFYTYPDFYSPCPCYRLCYRKNDEMNGQAGSSRAPALGGQISPTGSYTTDSQQQQFQQQQQFYFQQQQQHQQQPGFHHHQQNLLNHGSSYPNSGGSFLSEPDSLRTLNNTFGPNSEFTSTSSVAANERLLLPSREVGGAAVSGSNLSIGSSVGLTVSSPSSHTSPVSAVGSGNSLNNSNSYNTMVTATGAQQANMDAMSGYSQVNKQDYAITRPRNINKNEKQNRKPRLNAKANESASNCYKQSFSYAFNLFILALCAFSKFERRNGLLFLWTKIKYCSQNNDWIDNFTYDILDANAFGLKITLLFRTSLRLFSLGPPHTITRADIIGKSN